MAKFANLPKYRNSWVTMANFADRSEYTNPGLAKAKNVNLSQNSNPWRNQNSTVSNLSAGRGFVA
jgi:hypothetical protein